jgi:hypothetical protein
MGLGVFWYILERVEAFARSLLWCDARARDATRRGASMLTVMGDFVGCLEDGGWWEKKSDIDDMGESSSCMGHSAEEGEKTSCHVSFHLNKSTKKKRRIAHNSTQANAPIGSHSSNILGVCSNTFRTLELTTLGSTTAWYTNSSIHASLITK